MKITFSPRVSFDSLTSLCPRPWAPGEGGGGDGRAGGDGGHGEAPDGRAHCRPDGPDSLHLGSRVEGVGSLASSYKRSWWRTEILRISCVLLLFSRQIRPCCTYLSDFRKTPDLFNKSVRLIGSDLGGADFLLWYLTRSLSEIRKKGTWLFWSCSQEPSCSETSKLQYL